VFALDRGEDALIQASAAVAAAREIFAYLLTESRFPAAGEAFGGNDAVGVQLFSAESVVAFRVELGVGQHTSYPAIWSDLLCRMARPYRSATRISNTLFAMSSPTTLTSLVMNTSCPSAANLLVWPGPYHLVSCKSGFWLD
jgi:hypothetical protein